MAGNRRPIVSPETPSANGAIRRFCRISFKGKKVFLAIIDSVFKLIFHLVAKDVVFYGQIT